MIPRAERCEFVFQSVLASNVVSHMHVHSPAQPCFASREECADYVKRCCNVPTNPDFPHLTHVYCTCITWDQVQELILGPASVSRCPTCFRRAWGHGSSAADTGVGARGVGRGGGRWWWPLAIPTLLGVCMCVVVVVVVGVQASSVLVCGC
jgi:hypothetical protein